MRKLLVLSAFLIALMAACGGEEAALAPTPTPSPTAGQRSPTPQPTPTPTATPEPAVQRFAYISTDSDIWIINADGSNQQKVLDIETEPGAFVNGPWWAPDGGKFAVVKSNARFDAPIRELTYIVSAEGETLLELPSIGFAAWLPRGDTFFGWRAGLDVEPALLVLDLQGNTVAELSGVGSFSGTSFAADGQHLAFLQDVTPPGGAGGMCGLLRGFYADIQMGEVRPIDPDEQPVDCGKGAVIFSPTDPSLLAYGDDLFDLDTGEQRPLPGEATSWSPDGQRLLLIPQSCDHVQVYDVETSASLLEFDITVEVYEGTCRLFTPRVSAWSPDSRHVATSDSLISEAAEARVVHIREIATGDDRTISVAGPTKGAASPQFSPDGRYLLFLGPSGIWVAGSDGSDPTSVAEGSQPAWQPTP
jgi:Tol biopolymer transport system component